MLPIQLPLLASLSLFSATKKEDEQKSSATEEQASVGPPVLSPEDEVIMMIKYAKLAEMKQEFRRSEEFYHKALGLLVIYSQNKSWDEFRIIQAQVYIYDSMANLALMTGQLDKAETLFKEALRGLIQQGMKKEDDAVIEISLKIAMIYAAKKMDEEAVAGYKYCIETLETRMKTMTEVDSNTKALLGMSTDAYSRFLISRKQYKEALECLTKALDIAKSVFGEMHPQVAVLLNDIATVLSLMQNYGPAKDNLKKAIVIAEATESTDLPALYCNLGSLHWQTTDIDQAKLEYNKAVVVAKKYEDKETIKKAQDALTALKKNKAV